MKILKQRTIKYRLPVVLALLLLAGILATQTQQASGAAATSASIEACAPHYVADSPMTIRVYDVAASGASFVVTFTYDSSGTDTLETKTEFANISVDLGSSDDEWVDTFNWPSPTAGAYIRVHVFAASSGGAALDSTQVQYKEVDDYVPVTFFIELAIPFILMFIFAGVAAGLIYRRFK